MSTKEALREQGGLEDCLTLGRLARELGLGISTARKWSYQGMPCAGKDPSGYRRFCLSDVEAWIEQQAKQAPTKHKHPEPSDGNIRPSGFLADPCAESELHDLAEDALLGDQEARYLLARLLGIDAVPVLLSEVLPEGYAWQASRKANRIHVNGPGGARVLEHVTPRAALGWAECERMRVEAPRVSEDLARDREIARQVSINYCRVCRVEVVPSLTRRICPPCTVARASMKEAS